MITPAFSRALVSCSHTRTLTGSSDEIIVCCSVVVFIVVFAGGMGTNEIPPSEVLTLKPSTSVGSFEVLVFPPSLGFSSCSFSEDGELIPTPSFRFPWSSSRKPQEDSSESCPLLGRSFGSVSGSETGYLFSFLPTLPFEDICLQQLLWTIFGS